MSFTSAIPQWGSIIDLQQDWKPYNQYPQEKTDQDFILQLIVDGTNEWLQTYLDRPIAPTQFEERFNGWSGWGGAYVMLPYVPVLEVVSVTEWWGTNGPHVLVEQTPEYQWGDGYSSSSPSQGTYQINPRTGMLSRTFPGNVQKPFFPGSRNVEVTWIAGYDPVPAQVKLAALEMANHWYRNTQEQAEQAPPYGGQAGDGPVSAAFWPGVPAAVVEMLQPFLQQGMG